MKLLLDEQINPRIAEQLRQRKIDVIAVAADPQLKGRGDAEIFAAAQTAGRVVVTYDTDFLVVIREYAGRGADHCGLIILNPTRLPNRLHGRVTTALASFVERSDHQPSFVVWIPR